MKVHSWEIIDDTIAIKKIDLSALKYHGSGIPKETKWFWDINDMKNGEKKNITLIYKGISHKAYIVIEKFTSMRARIYWHSDFLSSIEYTNCFYKKAESFPYLMFEKVGKDIYDVSVIKESEDYNDECITIEEINSREGKKTLYYTSKYERNPKNRKLAIQIHGLKCNICGFDYANRYGILGEGYIEVHHKKPLFSLEEEIEINPKDDLITICANCHRMLHRNRNKIITIEELEKLLKNADCH